MKVYTNSEGTLFKSIIENLPFSLLILDSEGKVVKANSKLKNFLGRSNKEIEGKKGGDIFYCKHRTKNPEKGCGYSDYCMESCKLNLAVKEALTIKDSVFQKAALFNTENGDLYFDIKAIVLEHNTGKYVLICLDDQTVKHQHDLLKVEHTKLLSAIETGAGICH